MSSPDPLRRAAEPSRATIINWRDLDHSLAGGSERYAWEFALGLREAGMDVEFLTARDDGQRSSDVVEGIRVVRRGGRFTFYPRALLHLARQVVTSRGPHVVIDAENGIPSFSPLVLGPRTAIILVVHHVHQDQFRTYFPRPFSDLGRFLESTAMRWVYKGRTTVVVSDSTSSQMRQQLRWRGDTVLLPNGSLLPEPGEVPPTEDERCVDGTRRLVVFGRMARHKRIDLVLRAVAALHERGRLSPGDVHVDVVGDGPIADEIRGLVSELGLEHEVTIHGFISEAAKAGVLRRSSLNVCASDTEGWGQAVIEAAAYGVPTLARDVPGLRDSILPGRTGWLVPDSSASSAEAQETLVAVLADGISDALVTLQDPDEALRVRSQCQEWARRFTWPTMRQGARDLVRAELAALPTSGR